MLISSHKHICCATSVTGLPIKLVTDLPQCLTAHASLAFRDSALPVDSQCDTRWNTEVRVHQLTTVVVYFQNIGFSQVCGQWVVGHSGPVDTWLTTSWSIQGTVVSASGWIRLTFRFGNYHKTQVTVLLSPISAGTFQYDGACTDNSCSVNEWCWVIMK